MNIEVQQTSRFKCQLKSKQNEKQDKRFRMNSRKYLIEAEEDQAVTQAIVEFVEDGFQRITAIPRDEGTGEMLEKVILLDIIQSPMQNGEVI